MKDIISQFNNTWQSEDIFQAWQEEVRLRNCLRTCTYSNPVLRMPNSDTLDFLYRSLYWNDRRQDFFCILFANMNDLATCKWLNSNPDLAREFLAYIPYHIMETQPDFRQLQFLINIYRDEYRIGFTRIVNVLGAAVCEELTKRTASQELRALLRQRLIYLQKQQNVFDYGIKPAGQGGTSYPALYGDKMQLLIRAASELKTSQQVDPLGLCHNQRFGTLIEAASAVFEGGLVEDSVAILADAYASYLDSSRIVRFDEEALLYQNLYRLLRRIIPMYALFSEPSAPFTYALSCYRTWFGLVSPDPASLQFLKMYETILEGSISPDRNLFIEISLKIAVIKNYRPDDFFVLDAADWCRNPVYEMPERMHRAALERMRALPHEAFIILEFLHLAQTCYPGCIKGLNLLNDYMELWKWTPLSLFLNQKLVQELGPYSDARTRRQAEKAVKYSQPESGPLIRTNPDFMELFARAFMGVF